MKVYLIFELKFTEAITPWFDSWLAQKIIIIQKTNIVKYESEMRVS